jgi:hypothetical protein
MTQTLSSVVRGIFRAAALVSMMLLLSGVGLAQKVVTARATIPFKFWAEGHEFQAGDYIFDNEVPGCASIHRERNKFSYWGLNHSLRSAGRKRQSQSDLCTSRRKVFSSRTLGCPEPVRGYCRIPTPRRSQRTATSTAIDDCGGTRPMTLALAP